MKSSLPVCARSIAVKQRVAVCLFALIGLSGCMFFPQSSESHLERNGVPSALQTTTVVAGEKPEGGIPQAIPLADDESSLLVDGQHIDVIGEFPPKEAYPNIAEPLMENGKILSEFEGSVETKYRLGAGDEIYISVWDHADITGDHVIGPDGEITLAVVGGISLAGKTREEAAVAIQRALASTYGVVTVTVSVKRFTSNTISILGQVQSPGVYEFVNRPTLLSAISRAGGIYRRGNTENAAVASEEQMLPSCGIIRGKNKFAWISLKEILHGGNLTLNISLQPDDIIYISEWKNKPIYVFGEVRRPGIVQSAPSMTILDALGQVGGFTADAATDRINVISPEKETKRSVSFRQLLRSGNKVNALLNEGDILFVPSNRRADVGYLLQKLTPLSWLMFYYSYMEPSPVLKYSLNQSKTSE